MPTGLVFNQLIILNGEVVGCSYMLKISFLAVRSDDISRGIGEFACHCHVQLPEESRPRNVCDERTECLSVHFTYVVLL